MYQIKKKYLLNSTIDTLIDDLKLQSQEVSIFFTNIKVCKETKYSHIPPYFYKTTKNGTLGSLDKRRRKITKELYEKMKKKAIGYKIKKSRFLILDNKNEYYIDKYRDKLSDIYTLEIILNRKSDLENFKIPDTFKHYIIKDITSNDYYLEKNLALLGEKNKSSYDIYSIFKDIELGRNQDLKKIIFDKMHTSDALRIVLLKLLTELKISKDLIVETGGKKGLKKFDKAIKKSRVLLSLYENIFDKNIIQKVISHLKIMKIALKTHKDLKFIQKELAQMESLIDKKEMKGFQKNIKEKISKEKSKITLFFNTRKFSIIFRQYELMIKESSREFLKNEAKLAIENTLNEKILKLHNEIDLLCKTYKDCESLKSYKRIKKSFTALKIIDNEFDMLIDNNDNDKVLTKLINIEVLKKKRIILYTYLENLKHKPEDYDKLLETIENESSISMSKKVDEFKTAFKNFKNKSSNLL